jgi:hypothetical protein
LLCEEALGDAPQISLGGVCMHVRCLRVLINLVIDRRTAWKK